MTVIDAAPPALEKRAPLSTMRRASFAMCLMLLVQYVLGIAVNLFVPTLPKQDHGASGATAFARALANGPVGLSIHGSLGLALTIVGLGLAVRAARTRRWALSALAIVGLVSLVGAALSGARFVGTGQNGASMGMAVSWAIAMVSYLLIMYFTMRERVRPYPTSTPG